MTNADAQHPSTADNTAAVVEWTVPTTTNVIDRNGGFTAETKPAYRHRRWDAELGDTLWRPGGVLSRGTTGTLVAVEPHAFYQTNEDATCAKYRVPGYPYPVVLWFDNRTGERIA